MLILGEKRKGIKKKRKSNKHIYTGIVVIFLGLLILAGFICSDNNEDPINYDRIKTIKGHLSLMPDNAFAARNVELRIYLKEYPQISFINSGYFYSATDVRGVTDNIYKDDSIVIYVLKEDYERVIEGINDGSCICRALTSSSSMSMYGIIKNGHDYVSLSDINNEIKTNDPFSRKLFGFILMTVILFQGFKVLLFGEDD